MKKWWNIVWYISAGAMIVFFLVPLIRYGVWNIGNLTGMALGMCFLGVSVCQNRKVLNGRYWKQIRRGLLWLSGGILLLTMVETTCMIQACLQKPSPENVVVVLGCKVKNGKPSLMLEERLQTAYAYLQEHETSVCVLSGGQGADESLSEADCMYRYLTKRGIAPHRLFKEEKSCSTRENILYTKQLLQKQGLEMEKTRWTIVTNEFHQYRAQRIGKALGVACDALPARTKWELLPTFYIRELYGILYEWIFGTI